ncbi:TnpV protein [Thomasclavelia saccharogumia]|uniref:TnpV protein n=1 Tax=Thomasclavelia saccharogumia TaxID=341225 RepID=UPI000479B093|nr:TnpV protein [Thomasclavelia saccharogumia]
MAKSIFEEMGGTYHEENGYLIPDLTLPTEEEKPIGIWGQRHLRYIKEHKRLFYVNLLTSGKLNSYLAEINVQAEELFFRLVKQLAEKEGITEELKSTNPMTWIGAMNNIQARTREIVYTDIIYT